MKKCKWTKRNEDKDSEENKWDECVYEYYCSAPYPEWLDRLFDDNDRLNGIDECCHDAESCKSFEEVIK